MSKSLDYREVRNMETMLNELKIIEQETVAVINELLESHPLEKRKIFVIGCSTSAIHGGIIGKDSNEDYGKAVFSAAYKLLHKNGIYLAAQCCEHLNRALVVEKECALLYGLEIVSAVPWIHGGGAFAAAAYRGMKSPVLAETVRADAGIDIGGTLIGMHLKSVAVPFKFSQKEIGKAFVNGAWCRPKLIGGERARYSL
ncbi:MAG: TIGR01440 family protein [Treponema sp.]